LERRMLINREVDPQGIDFYPKRGIIETGGRMNEEGKSPKDLLYDKEKDSGYICSICAYKAFGDPRFIDCPIYGIYAKEKSEHDKIDDDKVAGAVEAIFGKE
ncbi:9541_t:CDS:2, partial [Paraglomus brasilianum]